MYTLYPLEVTNVPQESRRNHCRSYLITSNDEEGRDRGDRTSPCKHYEIFPLTRGAVFRHLAELGVARDIFI